MADTGTQRRPRVLVVTLSEFAMDARILRQVKFLRDDYEVVVAGFGNPPAMDAEFLELQSGPPGGARRLAESAGRVGLRLAGRHAPAYRLDTRVRRWREVLEGALPVDAIVVNDLFMLPLAREVAGGDLPVIFDAPEHWSSESSSWSLLQRISMRNGHEWIVDKYVPGVAGLMTVSPGIADAYAARIGTRPTLVTNAPFFHDLTPSEVTEPIRLFHAGVADERRRLEDTVEAVRLLGGRFTLDIALVRDNEYRRRIERQAASIPWVNLIPPLPQAELITFANAYDVGVHYLPAVHTNHALALPNKLFDYIQARLAVAIAASPAMVQIVEEWDCGIVSTPFTPEAFAESLGALSVEEVWRLKGNSHRAARVLTAESNRETLLSLMNQSLAQT